LIKGYLCSYTQEFALANIDPALLKEIAVKDVEFNYETETWETRTYTLPWSDRNFVLLTPKDLLTRDDNWINRHDLIRDFEKIPTAISDTQLRAQVANYFERLLHRPGRKAPTQRERDSAAAQTIATFPQLIDYFIRYKELHGAEAENISSFCNEAWASASAGQFLFSPNTSAG
jgi:hypothetical protein